MQKLFLLDAYALIFRSYYAFINRPIKNSKGQNTSAIYGFTATLDELIRKENPDYIAVVFDYPGPNFRNILYPEYKANRMKTPEEIKTSVPYIKKVLEGYNIPVIEIDGYEADDVIGTIAKRGEEEGFRVFMMTPDKDYGQLVSDNILMYKPAKSNNEAEILGKAEILNLYSIQDPVQVVDILALWGDASDNIPGAPGIGEKTAKELIVKYGTVENLFDHIHELKGKQRDSIEKNREQIILSKKLATLETHVPIEIDLEKFKRKPLNSAVLKSVFAELEFRTLSNRILSQEKPAVTEQGVLFASENLGNSSEISNRNTIYEVKHAYKCIENEEELKSLRDFLLTKDKVCFDTETTSLNTFEAELVGISFSVRAHEAWYIPVPPDRVQSLAILEILRPLFENEGIVKIGQNLKYDIQVLMQYGFVVKGTLFDTMIAHYLIQPELRHNMDYLSEVYLNYKPVAIEELIGKKGKGQLSMRDVKIEKICEYAAEDADVTWQLAERFEPELTKQGLAVLAANVEMPLIQVLADMERTGIKLNTIELNNYAEVLKKEITNLQDGIFTLAGMQFNIASPRQLGEILFEHLKIPARVKKTKTNQYPTGEEILQEIADQHDIIPKILDFRTLQKLLNTYVEALPALINPSTGRVHTSYEQAWVSTGRLSSKNPNLQNIPIRDERGREIRKAFIPRDENYVLLSADYSQIELRIMAHLCEDSNMIEAFRQNQDIHTATAAKIYNVSLSDVSREMRGRAKTANFGIIYGISSFGLSQRLHLTRQEATKLIEGYFNTYPYVRHYMNKNIEKAKANGYVETILGRRRYLPEIHSANALVRGMAERNAINAPIQGSAADIIKLAMVNIFNKIQSGHRSKMILQVHDELVFDVYKPELEEIKGIVKYEMENAITLKVPLVVDIGTGNNWLEAH
ncbi:MAG: polA [Bacteroidetes bacterium]|nr:polA [Bacteroidota bacterium]